VRSSRAHGTVVPVNAAATSAAECRPNHGVSSRAMVARWVYRSPQAEKSALTRRSRKAKVPASLVARARSANCRRVNAATVTLSRSAVAKSPVKPPRGQLPMLPARAPAVQPRRLAAGQAAGSAVRGRALPVMADVLRVLRTLLSHPYRHRHLPC